MASVSFETSIVGGGSGGGGFDFWDAAAEPSKIQSGTYLSPGFFVLSTGFSGIVDSVANATTGTGIYFNKDAGKWEILFRPVTFLGFFDSLSELTSDYPVATNEDYAFVIATNSHWYWSNTTSSWTNTGSTLPVDVLQVTDLISSITNTSTDKPASAYAAYLLNQNKVDKVTGKGLSTEDFTSAYKTKLDGIAAGAEVNVQADWAVTDTASDAYVKNKPSIYTQDQLYTKTETTTLLSAKVGASSVGVANGVASLDSNGTVPTAQIPTAFDEVLEYSSFSSFPLTGTIGKIYVDTTLLKTYRWNGTTYKLLGIELGDTSTQAFDGSRGYIAYVHSSLTGNPHGTTKLDIGLGNVDNTSDLSKPISTATQTALNLKADASTAYTKTEVDTFISGKIDKVTGAQDKIPTFTSTGNIQNSTKSISDFQLAVAGKGLSTEDFTSAFKTKLEGIATGAEVNVQADWAVTDTASDAYVKNKPSIYTQSETNTLLNARISTSLLGAASGVATLDSNSKLTSSQIPSTLYTKTETDTLLSDKVNISSIGIANGIASLGPDGKVPENQLPTTAVGVSSVDGSTGDVLTYALKYNATQTLTNTQKIQVYSNASLHYVGEYKMAAPSSLGSGWLLCNGAAVSRTTYASLFAAIGTSFGTGDGSTTFNLPDPRGRAVGISGQGSGLTNRTTGTAVGAETHTLSKAEIPPHSHTYTRANMGTVNGVGSADAAVSLSTNIATGNGSADGLSGSAHNNMQPTLFIGNLFIYAGV